MQYRNGETTGTFFRTDRFYCICGEWFFSTRENLQIGPFANKGDAEAELMLFLRHAGEGGIYAERYEGLNRQDRASNSWL